jgi:hypothetical protein
MRRTEAIHSPLLCRLPARLQTEYDMSPQIKDGFVCALIEGVTGGGAVGRGREVSSVIKKKLTQANKMKLCAVRAYRPGGPQQHVLWI